MFNLSSPQDQVSNFIVNNAYIAHRTTGCFDDRLLTMMTDTGFMSDEG